MPVTHSHKPLDDVTQEQPERVAMPCGWGCAEMLTARTIRTHFVDCERRKAIESVAVYGYVISARESGNYKVGISKNVRARLANYRTHSSETILVEFVTAFGKQKEALAWQAAVLSKYAPYVLREGWFKESCGLGREIYDGQVGGSTSIDPDHSAALMISQRTTLQINEDLREEIEKDLARIRKGAPSYNLNDWINQAAWDALYTQSTVVLLERANVSSRGNSTVPEWMSRVLFGLVKQNSELKKQHKARSVDAHVVNVGPKMIGESSGQKSSALGSMEDGGLARAVSGRQRDIEGGLPDPFQRDNAIPGPGHLPDVQGVASEEAVVSATPAEVLEHAARAEAPFGKSVTEHPLSVKAGVANRPSDSEISAHNANAPRWLPHLKKLGALGEVDPGSAAEEFATLLRDSSFRAPKGWANWSLEKRASWLDENKPLESKCNS